MRRLTVFTLLALTACSPLEEAAWLGWHRQDPQGAVDYLYDEGIADRPDHQGEQDSAGVYWPWTELAECESGGNWSADTGNGYYGGLQFAWGSWEAAGGAGNPAHASPSEQVMRGEILQDLQGWNAWPTCARIVGLI
jgi:Transglycosylase-like domain